MRLPAADRAAAALLVAAAAATLAPLLSAQFRGDVDVVEITATVTDGKGGFRTGLRADDFVVRENGVPQQELNDVIVASDVLVYALGFEQTAGDQGAADPNALKQITDATGGRTEMVKPGQLIGAVDRIADELGRQYYLAYERTGPRDGRRQAIQVEARAPGARVRARAGYVAD